MAFRKLCPLYVSGTSHEGFVPVCKVGLELSKVHNSKIKKIPILRQNSIFDRLGPFLEL